MRNRSQLGLPIMTLLLLLPAAALLISLFVGRYSAPPQTVIALLISRVFPTAHQPWPATLETAILDVRLPRILLALLVGMSLSISGASFQGLFRNPLVSSEILGVANGAALGAATAILLSAPLAVVQIAAFAGGLLAVTTTYMISRLYRIQSTLTLVLAGIIVGAFLSSLISLIKYIADPLDKLPAIIFWLMGSLSASSKRDVLIVLPPMIVGIGGLLLVRWRINLLSLGEEAAKSLGVNADLLRVVIVMCCTLATAAAVSVSGVIGFVGLVVPHVARMIVGPDHKVLLPASLVVGGTVFVLLDDIARSATTSEIPLGILTGLIGAPFFAYLLRKGTGWT
jgi:iron complex transport system permease protein